MLNYGDSSVNVLATENAWPKTKVSNFTVGAEDSFDFRVMFSVWDIDDFYDKKDQDKIGKFNVQLDTKQFVDGFYRYTSVNLKTRPCNLDDEQVFYGDVVSFLDEFEELYMLYECLDLG
jgi:hypothetical protein